MNRTSKQIALSTSIILCIGSMALIKAATTIERHYTNFDQYMEQQTGMRHFTYKAPDWKPIGLAVGIPGVITSLGITGYLLFSKHQPQNTIPMPTIEPKIPHQYSYPQTETHTPNSQLSTPKEPSSLEERKNHLWQLITNPENAWVAKTLKTPLLVWGDQGAGKTSFVSFLGILRIIFLNHTVEVNDPHAHLNNWLPCFKIKGHKRNYSAIDKALSAYYQRIDNATTTNKPHTSIWDEITQYAEHCTPSLAAPFLKSVLSDTRKTKEFPILISHNDTLSTLAGGKGGTHKMKEMGIVNIHLIATKDSMGEPYPSGKGIIKGLEKDDYGNPISMPITVPPWMQGTWLINIFPELAIALSETKTQTTPQTQLEVAWNLTPIEPEHEKPLPEKLQAIWQYARKQDHPVTARDVQRASLAALKTMNANDIREAFSQLKALGRGNIGGEGSGTWFEAV